MSDLTLLLLSSNFQPIFVGLVICSGECKIPIEPVSLMYYNFTIPQWQPRLLKYLFFICVTPSKFTISKRWRIARLCSRIISILSLTAEFIVKIHLYQNSKILCQYFNDPPIIIICNNIKFSFVAWQFFLCFRFYIRNIA